MNLKENVQWRRCKNLIVKTEEDMNEIKRRLKSLLGVGLAAVMSLSMSGVVYAAEANTYEVKVTNYILANNYELNSISVNNGDTLNQGDVFSFSVQDTTSGAYLEYSIELDGSVVSRCSGDTALYGGMNGRNSSASYTVAGDDTSYTVSSIQYGKKLADGSIDSSVMCITDGSTFLFKLSLTSANKQTPAATTESTDNGTGSVTNNSNNNSQTETNNYLDTANWEAGLDINAFCSAAALANVPSDVKAQVPDTAKLYNLSGIRTLKGLAALIKKIAAATASDTIYIYTGKPMPIDNETLEVLSGTGKNLVYMFTYGSADYRISIAKNSTFRLDGTGAQGPLYIGSRLGTASVLK